AGRRRGGRARGAGGRRAGGGARRPGPPPPPPPHDKVDFIPLHWYGSDFRADAATGQLRSYLQAVYNRYKKPIWLTEYALIDFSSGTPRYPTPEQQAAFVTKSTAMLQGLPFVERYAWFTLSADRGGTGLYNRATPNRVGTAYRAAG
ncbi:glycosyl hydrolase, partial [Kitasatospora sp. NPDC059803]|uniref:glycosyl hydrolase n=1 Tax=Kitasatospora sp. NPDC059803 TaxID=3346953 RepID=UPI00364CE8B4